MGFAERSLRVGVGLMAAALLIGCRAEDDSKQRPRRLFDPQVAAVEARMEQIAGGLQRYRRDVGDYPEKLEDLLASDAEGWSGPYVGTGPPAAPGAPPHGPEEHLIDPWGDPFEYVYDAKSPKLVSPGPDRKQDTEDDIVVIVSAGQ